MLRVHITLSCVVVILQRYPVVISVALCVAEHECETPRLLLLEVPNGNRLQNVQSYPRIQNSLIGLIIVITHICKIKEKS